MIDGQSNGTSDSLTVESAATVFEGLLSHEEEKQSDETKKAPDTTDATVEETHDEAEEAEPAAESDEPAEEATESEEDEDAGEEETEEAVETEPRTYRVKVDGVDVEVPEDELIRGYSRTADYTRKTQQLAEERRAFQSEAEAVRAERQKYAESLTQLTDALTQMQPAEPDWDRLRTENPGQYAATWAAWQQHKQEVAALESERQQVMAALAVDQQREFAEKLESERAKLVEAIPAWKDAATAKTEKAAIAEYARSLGYGDEDLQSVYDHRLMVMLRKAYLFDRGEKARATTKPIVQKRIEAAKVQAPGSAASTRRVVSETTKAKQRLAKTGRIADAAGVLMTMLPD